MLLREVTLWLNFQQTFQWLLLGSMPDGFRWRERGGEGWVPFGEGSMWGGWRNGMRCLSGETWPCHQLRLRSHLCLVFPPSLLGYSPVKFWGTCSFLSLWLGCLGLLATCAQELVKLGSRVWVYQGSEGGVGTSPSPFPGPQRLLGPKGNYYLKKTFSLSKWLLFMKRLQFLTSWVWDGVLRRW